MAIACGDGQSDEKQLRDIRTVASSHFCFVFFLSFFFNDLTADLVVTFCVIFL